MRTAYTISQRQRTCLLAMSQSNEMLKFCPEGVKARVKSTMIDIDTANMLRVQGLIRRKENSYHKYVISDKGLEYLKGEDHHE